MKEENYSNIISSEITKEFNSIYVIDVTLDKVYSYSCFDKELILNETLSFFDFMQKMTLVIHPDDLNGYFDNLSSNKIENNNGMCFYKYRIKENDTYKKCINISKVLPNQIGNIVLSTSLFDNSLDSDKIKFNELETKISNMSNKISEVILRIYNALDSTAINSNTSNYITVLLEQLIKEFPEFNKEFEKNILSQVNKVNNTLLIIDDDPMTRNLIKKTFNDDYEIIMATNGKEAIDTLDKIGFDNIVGIFLDILMPVMDGFCVLEYLRQKNILSKIPVVIISGTEDKETRQRVYKYNIADMLEKPFNLEIIKHRTKNLINLYKTSNSLNNMVFSQHNDLMDIVEEVIKSYKYDNREDILNVKNYFKSILTQVLTDWPEYHLSEYELSKIMESIDLYNIGLYVLPKEILTKQNLTEENIKIIKNHPNIGSKIVTRVLAKERDSDLINYTNKIVLMCHERYDGSGYPNNLKDEQIPFWIQCFSLAMEINRFLKNNKSLDEIIMGLQNKFNPKIMESLKKIVNLIEN